METLKVSQKRASMEVNSFDCARRQWAAHWFSQCPSVIQARTIQGFRPRAWDPFATSVIKLVIQQHVSVTQTKIACSKPSKPRSSEGFAFRAHKSRSKIATRTKQKKAFLSLQPAIF
jgi:hypothetical protein